MSIYRTVKGVLRWSSAAPAEKKVALVQQRRATFDQLVVHGALQNLVRLRADCLPYAVNV